MRKLIEVTDEGLDSLLGERVTFYCGNYIYTGKLIGVNDTFVKLSDAAIVYETGSYDTKEWKNAQKLPHDWHIQINWIESWGLLK